MLTISLENAGLRFNQDWIFGGINYEFAQNQNYAIVGGNGSGKSTLLQLLAASTPPSAGKVSHVYQNKAMATNQVFRYIALAAHYIEPIESLTLTEFLNFHFSLKPLLPSHSTKGIIASLNLEKSAHKPIYLFSSGMKQRVKLATALFAHTPVLLLDEPCTNLDQNGIDWYQETLKALSQDRLLIIASNQPYEYSLCPNILNIEGYK